MELLHPHCAGLDIHKETVVACVRHLKNGKVMTAIKTFKTTTEELIALSDWLTTEGYTCWSIRQLNADINSSDNRADRTSDCCQLIRYTARSRKAIITAVISGTGSGTDISLV